MSRRRTTMTARGAAPLRMADGAPAAPSAFITGASSGIGESYARSLAARGCDLVLVARRHDRLAALAQELTAAHGIHATVLAADLATDRGLAAAETAIAKLPSLAYLVLSAGFGTRGLFLDVTAEKSAAMVRLHALSAVRLARAALPGMVHRGSGSIVAVSSLGSFFTTAHYTVYSATKSFINMFCKGLAEELRGTGVRVQALCPGLTRTGFMHTEEYRDFSYEEVPAWAWMTADEVVRESLAAMPRGPVVFVPGRGNRAFVRIMTAPLIGRLAGWLITLASRGDGQLY